MTQQPVSERLVSAAADAIVDGYHTDDPDLQASLRDDARAATVALLREIAGLDDRSSSRLLALADEIKEGQR